MKLVILHSQKNTAAFSPYYIRQTALTKTNKQNKKMKKTNFLWSLLTLLMVGVMSFTLVSCSSDDDGGGTPPPSDSEGLVSNVIPDEDWSGDMQNGIATYVPYAAEDDEDITPYYAFNFKDGNCTEAVFDIVCPNEQFAKMLEKAFKDGSWAIMDDDDDDDDYDNYPYYSKAFSANMRSHLKAMTRETFDINLRDLALPVKRSGKVLYFYIDCLKGLSGADVKELVNRWSGISEDAPAKIIVGNYNEATGRYTCNNMHGIGVNYEINTTYENNLLKTYVTNVTFPNRTWAQMMYESLEEQNNSLGYYFGIYPEATISGNKVTENAAIVGDVTKEQTLEMIAYIDQLNSQPIYTFLAD